MIRLCIIALLLLFIGQTMYGQVWQAKWIAAVDGKDTVNAWFAFRKDIEIANVPKAAVAKIAVDSKYWLWVNGEMVVFEGGLKRGPNPYDTYYDEVDIAPYLQKGRNTVAVKLWFFGKDGFSHKNSGQAGLLFDCVAEGVSLVSDSSWRAEPLRTYQTAPPPLPNYRLPESSIGYDARLEQADWKDPNQMEEMPNAIEIGSAGILPWNKLVRRPIPLWKDFGLKNYVGNLKTYQQRGDTILCQLPYNAQFTPYLRVKARAGQKIVMMTDNYVHYNGSDDNIRAEYITKEGVQEYESLGWLNGHWMYYIIPEGVEVLDLKYRETGYDTEFAGSFSSSDDFLNKLWEKARRTLYITMRDTYMDCPDRERAQWTGDAVLEAEEAFYALDTASHALARKWLYELIGWQREDSSLYAPVPAGNWDKELPDQVLASIGYYGIWTYYLHTGDLQALEDLYPAIQRYLALWEKEESGLVKIREGGWLWGDWGDNKDMLPIFNLWYYLALKGSQLMAGELGLQEDEAKHAQAMRLFAHSFNQRFWNGKAYRDPQYTGKTDDRVHALAVVSGVADSSKSPAIMDVFATEEHASPYMEKYVYEAMYQMGFPEEANVRHEKRFSMMVNNEYFSTLFEGWGIGGEGFGGGTVNHAWSGGGLTILSSYLCGIRPLEPGYKTFLVAPQLGAITQASAAVASVRGMIKASFNRNQDTLNMELTVPEGATAILQLPAGKHREVIVNGNQHDFDRHPQIHLPHGNWFVKSITD
ncbi:alpha-L-rhamnosidase-related protein [Parapedobacter tibetensis]|uniref:alpha-L-rhamnosidase-related protein n=1 Tax=Parapedobacter tibetensis TaxID=2972951 RepID=UPI00214DB55D|nr:alpha-L-rhamnosidase C-terminal domain-containing protein [Parapedobacter tibetensis]